MASRWRFVTLGSSDECSEIQSDSTRTSSLLDNPDTLPDSVKARVQVVDPNQGSCLIENAPEDQGVLFTHCLLQREARDRKKITGIEWHWNIPEGSLNLDTRYNVFRVSPFLLRLRFKTREVTTWIFIPEDHIIKRYHDSVVYDGRWSSSRESFPVIPNSEFLYRFVPIDKCLSDVVIRRHNQRSSPEPYDEDYTVHKYPFDTLPLLKSHLHPKFAILEIGRALDCMHSLEVLELFGKYPILQEVAEIYDAWTEPCSFGRRSSTKRNYRTANLGDSDSIDSSRLTPPRTQRFVTDRSRKDSGYLSRVTLQKHTTEVGRRRWDADRVQSWAGTCPAKDGHQSP